MTESEFLRQPVVWSETGDAEFPYRSEFGGRVLTVRVGDFPDESLYALLVDDVVTARFDDWPSAWVRPVSSAGPAGAAGFTPGVRAAARDGEAAASDDTAVVNDTAAAVGAAASLPFARTNAEARLFLELQPCSNCGEQRCKFRSSVVTVDGVLASRYTGECPRCGQLREYQFRLPEEISAPQAGVVRFGGDEPSRLLDPGVWLWYSDTAAAQVPTAEVGGDEQSRRAARHALATALAALDEVLKFIPPETDSVPDSAFTSLDGRAIHDNEPRRFTRLRLTAIRDYYAERLAQW